MPKAWIVEKTVYIVCSDKVTSEAEALAEAKRVDNYEWADDEKGPYAYYDEIIEDPS